MTEDPSLAGFVPHRLLRRYLLDHGWRPSTFSKKSVELFALAGAEGQADVEIVLPSSPDSRSWNTATSNALTTLSQLEGRSVAEVVRDIRSVAADVIQTIVPDEYVWQDSIELRTARELTKGFRQFLAAAATSELNPAPYFVRTAKDALEYANGCRFGHTFRGSFGFRVESPVGLNDQPLLDGIAAKPVPFARRVVERIARGFEAVNQASQSEDDATVLEGFESGMNANMCDELVGLSEATGILGLKVGINFSPEWRSSVNRSALQLSISPRQIAILEHASAELRRRAVPEEVTVVGRVRTLQTDANPSDLLAGPATREVDVVWDSDNYGMIRVHIALEPRDYLEAVEAHKTAAFVKVTGSLDRVGRRWVLKLAKDFKRLDLFE